MDTNHWLDELKKQVDASSLRTVANAMGVSRALISLVVNEKYKGNIDNVQVLVESVFMGYTVTCPVLGIIPKHQCAKQQSTKHVSSAPCAIRLWKACRSDCPNSQLTERLNTPVKLNIEATQRIGTPTERREQQYNASAACVRLERQAKTDAGNEKFQHLYIDLLKRELIALGNRYNRLKK